MLQTIVANGGWVLIGIGLASLIALAVLIERVWRLLPLASAFRATWDDACGLLGTHAPASVSKTIAEWDNAMGRTLSRGLDMAHGGEERVREAALEAAQREVPTIERGLTIIGTVAQITPLMGLLGTVIGLIEAFQAASSDGAVTTEVLAGGIYKALGTTAAGLIVSIPAWIAYNSLSGMAGRLIQQLEHAAGELAIVLAEVES